MLGFMRVFCIGSAVGCLAMSATEVRAEKIRAEKAGSEMTAHERAALHALNGPDIKRLQVNGHDFCVKRAMIMRNASGTTVAGQLTCGPLKNQQRIYYTIRKVGGQIIGIDIRMERSGFAPIAGSLANAVVGETPTGEQTRLLIDELGHRVEGNWENTADLIVATIAVKLADTSASPIVAVAQNRGN